jgi:hypothetical protein
MQWRQESQLLWLLSAKKKWKHVAISATDKIWVTTAQELGESDSAAVLNSDFEHQKQHLTCYINHQLFTERPELTNRIKQAERLAVSCYHLP